MLYEGATWTIALWFYDIVTDTPTWMFRVGWGGEIKVPEGFLRRWRYSLEADWIPLADCFHWWVEILGTECECVIFQYRICGFRRFPIRVKFHGYQL